MSNMDQKITVTFVTSNGEKREVSGYLGMSILDVAREQEIDLEGACAGSLACSTCHIILEEKLYNSLRKPSDEENDMLDLAFQLTATSRLGCQVFLTSEMDGAIFRLPSASRNVNIF